MSARRCARYIPAGCPCQTQAGRSSTAANQCTEYTGIFGGAQQQRVKPSTGCYTWQAHSLHYRTNVRGSLTEREDNFQQDGDIPLIPVALIAAVTASLKAAKLSSANSRHYEGSERGKHTPTRGKDARTHTGVPSGNAASKSSSCITLSFSCDLNAATKLNVDPFMAARRWHMSSILYSWTCQHTLVRY